MDEDPVNQRHRTWVVQGLRLPGGSDLCPSKQPGAGVLWSTPTTRWEKSLRTAGQAAVSE